MKRRILLSAVAGALVAGPLAGCKKATSADTLVVGATPVPHADILKFVAPMLEKEGIKLKIVEFSDYVKPNLALSDKELDANFFQHEPYLQNFAQERGLSLSRLCSVHIEPMGVYSKRINSLRNLKPGAMVAIPNDPTNGGRALRVLADAGLFTLREGTGVMGKVTDIVSNPKSVKIVELEAATLARTLEDTDIAVINSNFAMAAGLNPAKDSIAIESKESPYANIVAIRTGDTRESLVKLAQVLRSAPVREFIEKKYQGAVVPTF